MNVTDKTNMGGLILKNRFVMAPIKTSLGKPGGEVSQDTIAFYTTMAAGGTSAIILEPMAALPDGREHPRQLSIHDDRFVEGITEMIKAIHAHGALAGIHLNHAGRAANPKVTGRAPLAPSRMACPTTSAEADAATLDQIREIVAGFGSAVRRAVAAGADFLEIQFGHGYLVSQFYSERTNKRNDVYGGTLENRMRFAREILEQVRDNRAQVPFIIRISGKEYVDGGLLPDELPPLLELIEKFGASAVHVGYGNACDSPPRYYSHMAMPEDEQYTILHSIRRMTLLPIIAAARMGYVPKIRRVLAENLADYIALGRPLLADPEFPAKLASGREEQLVLCGGCLEGCLRSVKNGEKITCIVNPALTMPAIAPTPAAKSVMVVGGGMAGMSAAIHLTRKGHRVSLYEKSDHLGGQADFASAAQFMKRQLQRTVASIKKQIDVAKIPVTYRAEVTPEMVTEKKPDAVILATGSRQNVPPIGNLESQYVLTSLEYFSQPNPVRGERILVVGLGMIGLEAAAILALQNKQVIGVEPLPTPAENMEPISRTLLLKKLAGMANVKLFTQTLVKSFVNEGVLIEQNGKEELLPCVDTVIIAAGMRSEKRLSEELTACCDGKVYAVGDARAIGDIKSAFADGLNVAYTL